MTELTLTVLACEAGRSSGYLLRHGASSVLVDSGPGVIRALEEHSDPAALSGVVITHEHADHSVDLIGLGFRLRYPTPHDERIPLYVPAEMTELLDRLDDLFGAPTIGELARPIGHSFRIVPLDLDAAETIVVAPGLAMTPFRARHAVSSAALRFETNTAAVAFSSDTGPVASLVDAARATDMFICEATYGVTPPQGEDHHGHLTAAQAAHIATQAGTRALLLTHLSSPAEIEPALAAAGNAYSGPIDVAARNHHYTCGPSAVAATSTSQMISSSSSGRQTQIGPHPRFRR